MGRNFDDYPDFQQKARVVQTYETHCIKAISKQGIQANKQVKIGNTYNSDQNWNLKLNFKRKLNATDETLWMQHLLLVG